MTPTAQSIPLANCRMTFERRSSELLICCEFSVYLLDSSTPPHFLFRRMLPIPRSPLLFTLHQRQAYPSRMPVQNMLMLILHRFTALLRRRGIRGEYQKTLLFSLHVGFGQKSWRAGHTAMFRPTNSMLCSSFALLAEMANSYTAAYHSRYTFQWVQKILARSWQWYAGMKVLAGLNWFEL